MIKMESIDSLTEMGDNRESFVRDSDLENMAKALDQVRDLMQGRREAPTEEMHINLNEKIKFRLTERGKYIWYHQHDRLNEKYGKTVIQPSLPEIDADGYTELQLWQFIQLFGPYTGMTSENYIEPLEVVFEPNRKKYKQGITVKELYEYCRKHGAEDYTIVLEDENLARAELQKEDISFSDREEEVIV